MSALETNREPTEADRRVLVDPLTGDAPLTVAVMVSSVDGRTTVAGRVGALTGPADQWLLSAAREAAAAVVIGAATLRAEGYGRLLDDPARRRREQRGRPAEPELFVVGRTAQGLAETDAFGAGGPSMTLLVPSSPEHAAEAGLPDHVRLVSLPSGDGLDLRAAWAGVRERHPRGLIVCEGGPTLLGVAVEQRLVDQLLVCISPRIEGGAGKRLVEHAGSLGFSLSLAGAATIGGFVFLRYVLA